MYAYHLKTNYDFFDNLSQSERMNYVIGDKYSEILNIINNHAVTYELDVFNMNILFRLLSKLTNRKIFNFQILYYGNYINEQIKEWSARTTIVHF